jgi:hypothetical protein
MVSSQIWTPSRSRYGRHYRYDTPRSDQDGQFLPVIDAQDEYQKWVSNVNTDDAQTRRLPRTRLAARSAEVLLTVSFGRTAASSALNSGFVFSVGGAGAGPSPRAGLGATLADMTTGSQWCCAA